MSSNSISCRRCGEPKPPKIHCKPCGTKRQEGRPPAISTTKSYHAEFARKKRAAIRARSSPEERAALQAQENASGLRRYHINRELLKTAPESATCAKCGTPRGIGLKCVPCRRASERAWRKTSNAPSNEKAYRAAGVKRSMARRSLETVAAQVAKRNQTSRIWRQTVADAPEREGDPCRSCGGPKIIGQACAPCKRIVLAAWIALGLAPSIQKPYLAAKSRAWRLAHPSTPESRAITSKKYKVRYRKNATKILAAHARYRAENPEKARAATRRWAQAHPIRCATYSSNYRARTARLHGSFTDAEWQAILVKFDYRCVRCRKRVKMTVDHIIPRSAGGPNYAFNLQPMCGSCNSSKGNRIAVGTQHSLFERKPD